MYVLLLMAIVTFVAPAWVYGSTSPIRYEVKDNSRLFMPGSAKRYVDDLHVYMRCFDAFKAGQVPEKCVKHRQDSPVADTLVPNLRSGAHYEEYELRYDKQTQEFSSDYTVDPRRRLLLSVDKSVLPDGTSTAPICKWQVQSGVEYRGFESTNCEKAELDIELKLSEDRRKFSYNNKVKVEIYFSDGRKSEFESDIIVQDILIVALGDSFTSGEGNPERNRTSSSPAQWFDYRCHRSVFSYPVIAAAALALADPRHSVTLVHVACSGADTVNGILGEYSGALTKKDIHTLWKGGWFWERWRRDVPPRWTEYGGTLEYLPPQISQVKRLIGSGSSRRPELVLLSIGVNDIGLVGVLKKLARKDCGKECFEELRRARMIEGCAEEKDPLKRSFSCLDKRLSDVRDEIDKVLAPQHVYLMQYLNPLYDNDGNRCMTRDDHKDLLKGVLGAFAPVLGWFVRTDLSADEIKYADEEFFAPLKAALNKVADAKSEVKADANAQDGSKWTLVRPAQVEDRRGFCGKKSWYHKYQESIQRQHLNPDSWTDSVGTLHPNTFGHYFVAVRVLSQLRKDGWLQGHNLTHLTDHEFSRNGKIPRTPQDKLHGFAWYIWNMDDEPLSAYHKF